MASGPSEKVNAVDKQNFDQNKLPDTVAKRQKLDIPQVKSEQESKMRPAKGFDDSTPNSIKNDNDMENAMCKSSIIKDKGPYHKEDVDSAKLSQLLLLPTELLEKISSYLSTDSLCSFRLTCKYICQTLYPYFASEFFTKRQFMIYPPSLQCLLEISSHNYFARHLKHVIIGLDYVHNELHKDTVYKVSYTLAPAFKNLPNLSIIGLRDFPSAGRDRDGPGTCWNSYGYSFAGLEYGIPPTYYSINRYKNEVFSAVMRAAQAANVKLSQLQIILRKPGAGLQDEAFQLDSDSTDSLQLQLQDLQVLLLNLDLSPNTADSVYECNTPHLNNFLSQAKNLRHIRFNYTSQGNQQAEAQLRWFGNPSLPDGPSQVILNQLARIDIGTVQVSVSVLVNIVQKFSSTLESLSLWKVTLTGPTDISYTPQWYELPSNQKPNQWASFFKQISQLSQLNLKQLLVGWVKQMQMKELPVEFDFSFDGEEVFTGDAQVLRVKEYRGSLMDIFLEKLSCIDNVHVKWTSYVPPSIIDTDHSDETDGTDEDEEDDEDDEEEEEYDDDGEDDDYE